MRTTSSLFFASLFVSSLLVAGAGCQPESAPAQPSSEGTSTSSEGVSVLLPDGAYALNVEKSTLAWEAKKTFIVDYKHNGTVPVSEGTLTVENGAIMGGQFTIDMTAIKVLDAIGGERLLNHLKSPDFFDVAQYPAAAFAITKVDKAAGSDAYDVTGDLTIKGITNAIAFPAAIKADAQRLTAHAEFEIDRTLWDVRFGSGKFFEDIGDQAIDDKIKIVLDLETL
ncbi:YceI family protein [Candidatus Uhrbacteria bacterium]|nr:YceI family protein [Candidatus Uhrbacteria bacterium]